MVKVPFEPCLIVTDNLVDVLTPRRKGASDDELKELFLAAVRRRQPYYKSLKGRWKVMLPLLFSSTLSKMDLSKHQKPNVQKKRQMSLGYG